MSLENRPGRRAWLLLVVCLFMLGAGLAISALLPFTTLKPTIDSLARDGEIESFTPGLFQSLRIGMGLSGLALLALGGMSLRFRQTCQALLGQTQQGLVSGWYAFWRDLGRLWQFWLRVERDPRYLVGLALLFGLGVYTRFLLIEQPFRYDESYTFIAFALRPLQAAISDYHLPNNHILHTILVRAAYLLFGPQPWAVRLPAYVGGVLLAPAAYLAARQLYNRRAGLLSAALVVSSWPLIDYSANARGYTLLALFWLLNLALGAFLKQHKNLAGWWLLALLMALGFYIIPIMLYPFGILMAWLLCSWLGRDISPDYGKSFPLYLLGCGLAAAALTLLLYLPVLQVSGLEAVTANQYVRSPGWETFLESLPGRISATWRMWRLGWPPAFDLLVLLGVGLSLIFHKRVAAHRIPLHLAALLGLAGILVIQQIVAVPKVWLFLLPLFLVWAAAGWVGFGQYLFAQVQTKGAARWESAYILAVIGLAGLLTLGVLNNRAVRRTLDPEDQSLSQEVALYLKENLQDGDAVLAAVPINYPLRYYFLLYNIPPGYYYQEEHRADYQRLLVVAEPGSARPLEYVLDRQGLLKRVEFAATQIIYRSGPLEIYALPFR